MATEMRSAFRDYLSRVAQWRAKSRGTTATEMLLITLAPYHRNDWHNMTEMAGTMATELSNQGQNLVGHAAYGSRRCIHSVHIHQVIPDVSIGSATGVEGNDLAIQVNAQRPLSFADQFRLEGPIAIAGGGNLYLTHACLHLLVTLTVLAVRFFIFIQMCLKFPFQSLLQKLLE